MAIGSWAASAGGGHDPRNERGAPGASKTVASPRPRVLVVDDDPSILATMRDILTAEGCEVATAAGGREAIELVRAWHPTLLLLDMRMPVTDGWAVARAVRERAAHVPIVVMTAAESAARWASEIDADGYLAKPFSLSDLLQCIDRYRGGGGRN